MQLMNEAGTEPNTRSQQHPQWSVSTAVRSLSSVLELVTANAMQERWLKPGAEYVPHSKAEAHNPEDSGSVVNRAANTGNSLDRRNYELGIDRAYAVRQVLSAMSYRAAWVLQFVTPGRNGICTQHPHSPIQLHLLRVHASQEKACRFLPCNRALSSQRPDCLTSTAMLTAPAHCCR